MSVSGVTELGPNVGGGGGGGGGSPTGPAGGDLSGTYPDPVVAKSSVNAFVVGDGSTDVTIGSAGNQSLTLQTNSTNAIVIDNQGFVGLGNPINPLFNQLQIQLTGTPVGISVSAHDVIPGDERVGGGSTMISLHNDAGAEDYQLGYITDALGSIANYQTQGNGLEFDFYDAMGSQQAATVLLSFGGILAGSPFNTDTQMGFYNYGPSNVAAIGRITDMSTGSTNIPTIVISATGVGIGNITAPDAVLDVEGFPSQPIYFQGGVDDGVNGGGSIVAAAGDDAGAGPGYVSFQSGSGTTGDTGGGNVNFTGGNGFGMGNGGGFNMGGGAGDAGPGGAFTANGGGSSSGNGGSITLTGGASSSGVGGGLSLTVGVGGGGDGDILIDPKAGKLRLTTSSTSGYVWTASSTDGSGAWSATAATLPSLTNGDIWIGNGSNVATANAISGDMSLSNTGVVAVTKIQGTAVAAGMSPATNDILSWGGSNWTNKNTVTTTALTVNGTSSAAALKTNNITEVADIVAAAPSATTNLYVASGAVQYYTTNAANNFVVNFAWSAGTSMATAMATGDSVTTALLVTQGGTPYYATAINIDGGTSGVTTKWQGGTAPVAGNASGIDVYSFTVIKTAATPTYTVLASLTQF